MKLQTQETTHGKATLYGQNKRHLYSSFKKLQLSKVILFFGINWKKVCIFY